MREFTISVNGISYEVIVEEKTKDGREKTAPRPPVLFQDAIPESRDVKPVKTAVPKPSEMPKTEAKEGEAPEGEVNSPMPGNILAVNFKAGDQVKSGDTVMILEAMKMENEILAPADGTIKEVYVQKGATVETGSPLFAMN